RFAQDVLDSGLLESRYNIHRRPQSPVYIMADDYPLGNLKFVSKGGVDEVFGMPIPKDLITNAIQNSEYYKKYLEMAAPPIGGVAVRKPDSGITQKLPVVEGNGKGIVFEEQVHITSRLQSTPQDGYIRECGLASSLTDSTNDAETTVDMEQSNNETDTEILNVVEERGEEVSNMVALEERIAGPNPEPMHKDFIATVYLEVHESLKLTTEEQVHLENPPSSFGTLSSMKNLEDAFTFASSSVPPLSTPIIDLSPPKPVSPSVQEPIITATTITTTTLLPPPSPPPQRTIDPDLATHVSALKKRSADLEQKNQL
ncbi:hypothetical protein Tco_1422395, partial [Tanacetum coccineum]